MQNSKTKEIFYLQDYLNSIKMDYIKYKGYSPKVDVIIIKKNKKRLRYDSKS